MAVATPRFPVLPLLERVRSQFCLRNEPLRHVGMVCLQHLLETTGSLFEQFLKLGLRPEHTFILGKLYSTNPSVEKRLQELGFEVLPSKAPVRWGSYENHLQIEIEEMWNRASSAFRSSSIEQIVALDDGGCVLASVPRSSRLTLPVTGVEQTMSGIALQEAGQVHIPVVQVAASAVKKLLEPFLIQEAVFQRVSQCEFYRDGVSCGVVGLGSIGRAVLMALLRRHSPVYVFDKANHIMKSNLPSGAEPCSNLQELFRKSECVFGCTGTDVLAGSDWWQDLSGSRVLVSCSSHDREFQTVLKYLDDSSTDHPSKLADTLISTRRGELVAIRGGFPVNFDGSLESVVRADIQLTRSLLMGGVVEAAQRGTKPDEGYRALMLTPELQRFVVDEWLDLLPNRRRDYAPELLDIFREPSLIAEYSAGGLSYCLPNHRAGLTVVDEGCR